MLEIVSNDHRAVRIAEDNLCAHVDEFVSEEETALKHLLMEKYTSLRLRSHHDENRKEVGGKTGPRRICQCHKRTIDKRLNLIALSARDEQIVALHLNFNAESAESIGDNAQIAQRY